jgi:hypothetical protein
LLVEHCLGRYDAKGVIEDERKKEAIEKVRKRAA